MLGLGGGFVFGLEGGITGALMGGILAGLVGKPGSLARVTNPGAVLARDRRMALLVMLVGGVVGGFGFGLRSGGLAGGLVFGLTGSLTVGFGVSICRRCVARCDFGCGSMSVRAWLWRSRALGFVSFTLDWWLELSWLRIAYIVLAAGLVGWAAVTSVLAVVRLRVELIEAGRPSRQTSPIPAVAVDRPAGGDGVRSSDPQSARSRIFDRDGRSGRSPQLAGARGCRFLQAVGRGPFAAVPDLAGRLAGGVTRLRGDSPPRTVVAAGAAVAVGLQRRLAARHGD